MKKKNSLLTFLFVITSTLLSGCFGGYSRNHSFSQTDNGYIEIYREDNKDLKVPDNVIFADTLSSFRIRGKDREGNELINPSTSADWV